MMLQQESPDDYVLATNKQYSIREFIEICLNYVGSVKFLGRDHGIDEVGIITKSSKNIKICMKEKNW